LIFELTRYRDSFPGRPNDNTL